MNVIETMEAAKYLRRFGYSCSERTDRVVVQDPVQVSNGVNSNRTEHQPVTLRSFAKVVKFVADRS